MSTPMASIFGIATGFFLVVAGVQAQPSSGDTQYPHANITDAGGIVFQCDAATRLGPLQTAVDAYLTALGVDLALVSSTLYADTGTLVYRASPTIASDSTLDLIDHPALALTDAVVLLPTANGTLKPVLTVSQQEIVYAMLQPARASVFSGQACDVQALRDHIGVRQNIVAWAETLSWKWPNGGSARWNTKYWKYGTPVKGFPLHAVVNDAFMQQKKYRIGCYTATKLVILQGVLDYYHRIKQDPATLSAVEAILQQDGEPLTGVEPGITWQFEADSTPAERARPGKLLSIDYGIPVKNFIPGDWSYFLNTDPVSYAKTGYEGSNAVYLGRGKFDDFYDDHHHYYTLKEKLNEVYQWRNQVFSARRDIAKVIPLTAADYARLSGSVEHGGIQLDLRLAPRMFGYLNREQSPHLAQTP